MSMTVRASFGRRLAFAGFGLGLAVTLAGCGGEAACDNEIVKERAIEAVRTQYPNDVSKELLKRGSIPALDRILKERKLDQNDMKQLEVAARAAVQEMEDAWKNGRFTLENAGTVEFDPKTNRASCRARMVFMTSWGIAVRDLNYEATMKDGHLEVTASVPN